MNLHALVAGAIGVVNPFQTVTVQQSTGATKNADYTLTPTYSTLSAQAQIQALSGKDLRQIDGLNLQGTLVAIYFYGEVAGIIRASQKGGDLITIASGIYAGTWLATQVLEQWSDGGPASWCKIVATLQNGA